MSSTERNVAPMPDLLTIQDLATTIKTKEKTIRQWVYQGKIPNLKINGLVRFRSDDIATWIDQQARGGQRWS